MTRLPVPDTPRWGRHFSDDEIADARENGRLLTIELETSHLCNLRCVYCYSTAGAKLANELTLEEIVGVLDQAVALGLRRVIVIGGGEPLMHPRIFDILEDIHRRSLAIDLFTNGTLIQPDTARRLYDLGVEPVVKCNSLDHAVQDQLADLPGAAEMIRRGIENLRAAGYPDADHAMGIETIICARNYSEIPTLWRWARDQGIVPYVEMITFQGRARERRDLNVSVPLLRDLFYELSRIDRETYGVLWEPQPPIAALRCSRHEYSCTIDARGYVQPCTGIDIHVGNIRHQPLADILGHSPVIAALRNIREHVKGACRDCERLPGCYGCRGMAYHITGDFLAADPLCWRNPEHITAEPPDSLDQESAP